VFARAVRVGVELRVLDGVKVEVNVFATVVLEGVTVRVAVAVPVRVRVGVALRVAVRVALRVIVDVAVGGGQTASVCRTISSK
jgi:hypothetical protein